MSRDSGLKLSRVFSARHGRVISTFTPAVVLARNEVWNKFAPGLHLHEFSDEDDEMARRFDIEKALADAISARKAAGLPTETKSK